jgi:hypothetical protein
MESKGKNSFVKNIYTKFNENATIDSSLLVGKYRRTLSEHMFFRFLLRKELLQCKVIYFLKQHVMQVVKHLTSLISILVTDEYYA